MLINYKTNDFAIRRTQLVCQTGCEKIYDFFVCECTNIFLFKSEWFFQSFLLGTKNGFLSEVNVVWGWQWSIITLCRIYRCCFPSSFLSREKCKICHTFLLTLMVLKTPNWTHVFSTKCTSIAIFKKGLPYVKT